MLGDHLPLLGRMHILRDPVPLGRTRHVSPSPRPCTVRNFTTGLLCTAVGVLRGDGAFGSTHAPLFKMSDETRTRFAPDPLAGMPRKSSPVSPALMA